MKACYVLGTNTDASEVSHAEVTRSAVLLSAEHGRHIGDGIWFPDGRPFDPMRALLATWFPRLNEIFTLIGSYNLLATPSGTIPPGVGFRGLRSRGPQRA